MRDEQVCDELAGCGRSGRRSQRSCRHAECGAPTKQTFPKDPSLSPSARMRYECPSHTLPNPKNACTRRLAAPITPTNDRRSAVNSSADVLTPCSIQCL